MQRICDKTALPAVVPRLRYALQRHLDLSSQLEVLRAPSASPGAGTSRKKLRAWEDLKILAFTRAAASSLSLAVLSLHMRIMINVLSRQLYLEHALQDTPGRLGWPSLGVDAQEAFLALVEKGFPSAGIRRLIRAVRAAVGRKVADLQLSRSLDASQLRGLLEDIRGDVLPEVLRGAWMSDAADDEAGGEEDANGRDAEEVEKYTIATETKMRTTTASRWEDVLLPREDLVVRTFRDRARRLAATTTGGDDEFAAMNGASASASTAIDVAPGSPARRMDLETEQLLCMVSEVRATVQSGRFAETLETSMNGAWNGMVEHVIGELYEEDPAKTVAVAKLVPAMSNISGEFMEDPGVLLRVVAECEAVRTFTREIW